MKLDFITIKSPTKLCLYDTISRGKTLSFLNDCDKAALEKNKPIIIDLKHLEFYSASASVLLLSSIHRIRFCGIYKNVKLNVRIIPPLEPKIKGLFSSTGLLTAINCINSDSFEQLYFIGSNYLTGNDPINDMGKLVRHICSKYMLEKLPKRLSAAINEGMLNVLHHAYTKDYHNFLYRRWWSCVQVVEDESGYKHLQCIILDRGVGIVSNIKRGFPESIYKWELDENSALTFAMEQGISSTRISGRGQGSEDMKHPILAANNADYFTVISSKVEVRFENDDTYCHSYPNTIGATIIEWSLQFYE